MADATQFTFGWAEVAEMLIKKQGIHDGEWIAGIEITMSIGIMGPGPGEAKPGVMALANAVQLSRAQPGTPPHMVVDASKINPKK